jgi:hypothetical protein
MADYASAMPGIMAGLRYGSTLKIKAIDEANFSCL